MQIAIGMPIGYQSNAGKAAGVFDYLLNDTFTTDRAAGAVQGTDAEPGPGRRSVIDTNSKLSLLGGDAIFSNGAFANGDPTLHYNAISRVGGRVLIFHTYATTTGLESGWGLLSSPTSTSGDRLRFATTSLLARVNGGTIAVGTVALTTHYNCAVILRAQGALFFIKGGTYTNWTLLHISAVSTYTDCIPRLSAAATSSVGYSSFISVPSALWLPTPLVSDGFSSWGSSDDLGHAEGVAGGLGSGGSGKSWTQNVGSWAASGGVAAATALSGGRAIATVDAGKADVIISANMTVPTATLSLVVRWTDENNFVMLRRTPTNLQLVKVVAGVTTTVSDNASTYVAGAEVRLVCEGTKFRMFYNSAAVSTEQTIADAAVQSATMVGLRSGDTTCTVDNFVAYARGSGGEYAALDDY